MCDDLKYEINDSGNDVIITGYEEQQQKVPSEINGLPVTRIGTEVFQYCSKLKKVIT